ncbi:hypothetical protein [Eubacterium sp. 1001713B170207_170306_E7]|uniref:hypothetical protein n=1 Tax=Eubacterium sp. 1001713B170207_170306_E7 TaxID=2787097 RepID=UPI00189822DB|nr:hypothetical protein [Eubacterium sp. 1001713B170207_170306_E7]
MKSFKASVTLDLQDLLLLNKKYNRWSMGPSELLRIVSYFVLIYTVYTLFMVYLQIRLFTGGYFVYPGLFAFRLISGVLGALLFLGKFNPLLIRLSAHFWPDRYFSERAFTFTTKKLEIFFRDKKVIFAYGEIIKCDITESLVTLQTKHQNFTIHENDMTQGTWSEFKSFLKGKKDQFNKDPKLFRKEALKDL